MNWQDRITLNPEICGGKPTIRGMRITVKDILDWVAAGDSFEDILEAYPVLERDDIVAAVNFAAAATEKDIRSIKIPENV